MRLFALFICVSVVSDGLTAHGHFYQTPHGTSGRKTDNTAGAMTHPASVGRESVRHFRQGRSPSHTGLSICVSVRECVRARKWKREREENRQQEKEAERGCVCVCESEKERISEKKRDETVKRTV